MICSEVIYDCIYEIIYVQSVCFVILLVYTDVTSPLDGTDSCDGDDEDSDYEDEW